ncbi:MAG: hypothetical protein KF746_00800 [Chitinophagaceae bacterium]|nr:hypothetical protein [Chitinophagaceae bacterium]
MQKLKRIFYYFLGLIMLITAISMIIVGIVAISDLPFLKGVTNSSILMIVLVIVSFVQGQISKKDLAKLQHHADAESLFGKYVQYYKRKLLLNSIPVITSAALFVLTNKNIFFYILIIQIPVALVFFPRQAQILKELPGRDIIFQ